MNASKLVTFAFASRRRKLAMLTMVGVGAIGSLVGSGGDSPPAREPVAVISPDPSSPDTVDSPQTATEPVPVSTKCDGVHFNIPVAAGDKRDRDGDGIGCEKN